MIFIRLSHFQYSTIKDLIEEASLSGGVWIKRRSNCIVLGIESEELFYDLYDGVENLLLDKGINSAYHVTYLGKTLEDIMHKFFEQDSDYHKLNRES